MVFEQARAKINLSLDVHSKRADGYHEVHMVMQTVDFCDYVYMNERADDRIEIRSSANYVPTDERNLAYRVADLMRRRFGVRTGVTIEIDKRIPVAAGLAGGSADAAATLRGLNKLWNLGLTLPELAVLGAEIGSDVPFCVYGGTAVVTGRGEIVEPLPLVPSLWVVLAKPPIAVSTADIFGALRAQEIAVHPDVPAVVAALATGCIWDIKSVAGNVLEPVTMGMYPEVRRLRDQMERLGAQMALMSGSGPTVFGLAEREQRAKRVYNALRRSLKEVYLCRTC